MSTELDEYLKTAVADLPTIPVVAGQVMEAIDDPNTTFARLREIIERDTGLAARILRLSNSALFGLRSEIRSLQHAIGLIGLRAVRNLVLTASMKQTYKHFGLMEKLLWEHSTVAGPLAGRLARRLNLDPEEAFTAGLLHDIGKTALANSHRDEYEHVVTRVYNEKISFLQAERDHFHFDHAEIGACVAAKWGLPESLVSVIRYHHDVEEARLLSKPVARMTALVSVVTACLTRLGVGRREPVDSVDLAKLPAWELLRLTDEDLEPFLLQAREQWEIARSLAD